MLRQKPFRVVQLSGPAREGENDDRRRKPRARQVQVKNWVRQQQRSCKGDSEKGRGREGGTAGGHGEHGMNGEGKEAEFKKYGTASCKAEVRFG